MIYFITENYLKTYMPIGNNVDMSKIEHIIKLTYDISIENYIGEYFADYLLNKHQLVISGQDTYTIYEAKLVDLIQYTMGWLCAD